jgi:hypothetical protein
MGKRSSVTTLPLPVKAWLDKALVEGNFSGYEALSKALAERGFEVSKSSLHRYGQDFEARLATLRVATEQARAISEAASDEENSMGEALTRLTQQKAFEVLLKLEDAGDVSLPALGKMIAELNRSSVTLKRYRAEVAERAKAAAAEVAEVARTSGLSDSAVAQIRSRILGIGS